MTDEPPSRKKNDSWLKRFGFDKRAVTLTQWQNDFADIQKADLINRDLAQMIQAVLSSRERTVRDIMVPRAKMVTLEINDSFEEILKKIIESGHSRFPVLSEDHEEMAGVLLSKDLLRKFGDPSLAIASLLRPVDYVPEGKYVTALLNEFREKRSHLALVVDEYGVVTGLITIEDILEQIVGEIDDEHDRCDQQSPVRKLSDSQYIINAMLPVDEFNVIFDVHLDDHEVETINGLLMTHSGSLPKAGDEITIGRFLFKVLPYDGKSLDLLELEIFPGEIED